MSAITNVTPSNASELQALPSPIPVANDGDVITPAHHNGLRRAVDLLAHSQLKVGAGQTAPGAGWQVYIATGISIDVDTSAAGFTSTPIYLCCVGGNSSHWMLTGTSAIYLPTATSFRIYVRRSDDVDINPGTAATLGWYVSWIGIQ